MPFTQFTNLDFDEIKAQIKDFLRSNSNFTDFDFEGSNFSVIIDTLAYNTYINAFNANLVETIPTERFFNSDIGTDIRGSLFETFSRETLVTIEDQIRDTIGNFEPRVANLEIEASSRPDDNTFNVKVIFDIAGLNVPTQSFTFLLEPTR